MTMVRVLKGTMLRFLSRGVRFTDRITASLQLAPVNEVARFNMTAFDNAGHKDVRLSIAKAGALIALHKAYIDLQGSVNVAIVSSKGIKSVEATAVYAVGDLALVPLTPVVSSAAKVPATSIEIPFEGLNHKVFISPKVDLPDPSESADLASQRFGVPFWNIKCASDSANVNMVPCVHYVSLPAQSLSSSEDPSDSTLAIPTLVNSKPLAMGTELLTKQPASKGAAGKRASECPAGPTPKKARA